ncbi:MAG: hypothetical protein LBG95_03455 [Treponema sp.]|jgi:hypothetical protein|nr:hypothetical protein [Treponema sp.]
MGKRILGILGLVCVLLAFGACASQAVIFDESLPPDQSTHLFIQYGLEVKVYNGIPVPTKISWGAEVSRWHDVLLPPGEMEFMLDVSFRAGNVHFVAKDVFFRYKFEAGKYYPIIFTTVGGPDRDKWGVNIYDQSSKKENLLAFVPFSKYE